MKHNDSARIGSLSKWHTFDLTVGTEGRGRGEGRFTYLYARNEYILLLIVGKFCV